MQDFLYQHIIAELPFTPNTQQQELIHLLAAFLLPKEATSFTPQIFLLRGYAGTGKTSIMAAVVKALNKLSQKTTLLAPTGRAAKVLSRYAGFPAYTIHKQIYRQKKLDEDAFNITYNAQRDTTFIVDEASMISNARDYFNESGNFGTGCLLDDLMEYVFQGENCRLILVGDAAQLPPVGQQNSPALTLEELHTYGLIVNEFELTDVARQTIDSGILYNATALREQIRQNDVFHLPVFHLDFPDIKKLSGSEMLETLERSYREVGDDETIVVTRTNKRMLLYNQGIRARILWKEEQLTAGDRIMVTRNNYYFSKQYENLEFLANGDLFTIQRIRKERELYGFHFADASLRAVDYDYEIDVVLWLDTLNTESPNVNYEMQRTLFERIAEDYPEIHSRAKLVKEILNNQYFNALQIKHAYAVTCHKAQGGQWKRVFIDQGAITALVEQRKEAGEVSGIDYYRWLYTALTRATECVYLINFQ